jgi:hypothetical protein
MGLESVSNEKKGTEVPVLGVVGALNIECLGERGRASREDRKEAVEYSRGERMVSREQGKKEEGAVKLASAMGLNKIWREGWSGSLARWSGSMEILVKHTRSA